MCKTILFSVVVLLCAGASAVVTAQEQSLGEVARQLRQEKAKGAVLGSAAVPPAGDYESIADPAKHTSKHGDMTMWDGDFSETAYTDAVWSLLAQQKFEKLETIADEARSSKIRVPGGGWLLYQFYNGVSSPLGGKAANDSAWENHIGLLKHWVDERPQSITARVALANAYVNYGWKARGSGYADSVNEDGWKLLSERTEKAASILMDAYKLPAKCPYWFGAMHSVGMAAGFDKQQMTTLFQKAIEYEPSYYHMYREYANFLLPKWGGDPGEVEAFADQTYRKVGGKQGAFLYFEIASVANCDCSQGEQSFSMSWERTKEGYAALEATYGTTNLKRNRMALMAWKAGDRKTAHEMFEQIGDAWDRTTWRSRTSFAQARNWAQ